MEKSFFKEFSPLTPADQIAKIQFDQGGQKGYNDLLWSTPEGIEVHPIYPQADQQVNSSVFNETISWSITQYLPVHQNEEVFLSQLQKALVNGVECLYLELKNPCDFIPAILAQLQKVGGPIFFIFRYVPNKANLKWIDQCSNCIICYDFLAEALLQGGWSSSYNNSKRAWLSLHSQHKTMSVYVNAAVYANAGAHLAQQLTYALLHVNEYLNVLSSQQQKAPVELIVQFAFGSNYFFEIAKCHAFRGMLAHLIEVYDFPINLRLLGEPLRRNKCTLDYNVNLLRTSTEMMSAVLGGVDFVMNHPYDLRFNPPNDFADRIARNQLLLLKHESGFDQLRSPVAGTHYLSSLIEGLKAKSWAHFLTEEAQGGWVKIVDSNRLQKSIASTAALEKKRLHAGEQVLVGATKYQDDTTLNVKAQLEAPPDLYSDFIPLTLQYLQQ